MARSDSRAWFFCTPPPLPALRHGPCQYVATPFAISPKRATYARQLGDAVLVLLVLLAQGQKLADDRRVDRRLDGRGRWGRRGRERRLLLLGRLAVRHRRAARRVVERRRVLIGGLNVRLGGGCELGRVGGWGWGWVGWGMERHALLVGVRIGIVPRVYTGWSSVPAPGPAAGRR